VSRRFFPRGSLATSADPVSLAPADAGWIYSGLRVVSLRPGTTATTVRVDGEAMVLPITAVDVEVSIDGEPFHLDGRRSPFARVSDFVYAGPGAEITLHNGDGGDVAIAWAAATEPRPPRYGAAGNVPVDIFGAGPATRQRNAMLAPEAWPWAQRLMCVELLTPDGNWSSYPPHRHDDSPECPVNNEEIYYFRIGRAGSVELDPDGFGMHRTYTPAGDIDIIDDTLVVRDGDVYCVPRGYHGPCIAAPGYPMYYLNVLAGPNGERSMAFCDDPAHHWVRDTWSDMARDPRVPMATAAGPTATHSKAHDA
jgi:5-deoxy-glucuronate isomerase